jgi:2-amino-4-hydroxy-6-hydroxymethyldihydropteridine diphosphokinase
VTRYAIGLGSNLGDRLGHLVAACRAIAAQVDRCDVSSLYETVPVGGPDQGPFLNAVMLVETTLEPLQALDLLQEVEQAHDRTRDARWGPRTLDLDLLATDGPTHSSERLLIPHPRAVEREFVLRPLVEIWPDAPLGEDQTAERALATVGPQGVDRLARDWIPPVPRWPGWALVAGQLLIIAAVALSLFADGSWPEGEVTLWRAAGAVMAFSGLILAFVSSRRLGTALTANPVPKPGSELVVSGPYRHARHPIYGGLSLLMMGAALFLDSYLGLAVALGLVPYLWMKSGYEERQLRMRFGGYRAYREAVPRRLIPFVL